MSWLVCAILSAVFAACTAVLAKIGVTNVNSNLATAVRTTVVFLLVWPIAWYSAGSVALRHLPARTWLFLVLSGLATGASWICYFRALQLDLASRVAPIDKLSVVFVLLFAALFLGEKLTAQKTVGGLLITAGAIVLALD